MNRKVRILVVEDSPSFIRQYRRSLERAGFACEIVDTRDDAVMLLQNMSFEAAIIDLQLRNDITHKGGIDVLEYLIKCGEGTKAFAVSASESVRDSVKSYQTGAIEFVIKADMESTDEVVPRIKKALSKYRPQFFGVYDSLTAYLSAPEAPPYWERTVQDVIGCSYESLINGFGEGLKSYLPILRRKDGSEPFEQHKDRHAICGVFWSKGIGAPIWVSAFGPNGKVIRPKEDKGEKPESEASYGGFNIKVWRMTAPARGEFVEFIQQTPWAKPEGKNHRKRGTSEPWI
jgi:ActR/RegA family two-component response regulator